MAKATKGGPVATVARQLVESDQCPTCDGYGVVPMVPDGSDDFSPDKPCPDCDGAGLTAAALLECGRAVSK